MKKIKNLALLFAACFLSAAFFAGCGDDGGGASVTFERVTANGYDEETTTRLTLTFSAPVDGLTADNITLSGVEGVEKGNCAPSGSRGYTLEISGFTSGGELSVAVSKSGVTGSPKTVKIYYYTAAKDTDPQWFKDAAGMTNITEFNGGARLEGDIVVVSGSGSVWFGVPFPEGTTYADSVKITYACVADVGTAKVIVKQSPGGNRGSLTDISGTDNKYPTFSTSAASTITLKASGFTVLDYVAFQLNTDTNADDPKFRIKIISVERIPGQAIAIGKTIAGVKQPVGGRTPETGITHSQYAGTVTWSPAAETFTAGTVYNATIVLTPKAGYTFEAASDYTVAGNSATANLGADGKLTLEVTFPAAPAPAADLSITFANASEITIRGTGASPAVLVDTGKGFTVTTPGSYGTGYAYIKVDFGTGNTLSSYSKIKFDFNMEADGADGANKKMLVFAYAPAPTGSITENNPNKLGETANNASAGNVLNASLDIGTPAADLQEVYVVFTPWAAAGAKWTVKNIVFTNDE